MEDAGETSKSTVFRIELLISNALDIKVVNATKIHNFKKKLDEYWDNRDRTTRA